MSYAFNSNFLARINKLLSTDGISLDIGSFIYSTSGLNDGFTDEYSAKVEHPDRFELNSATAQIEQSNRRN